MSDDADNAVWRTGEWIATAAVIQKLKSLGVADPESVIISAARVNDGRGLIFRLRAGLIETEFEHGRITREKDAPLHSFVWREFEAVAAFSANMVSATRDWGMGSGVRITATGLEANADDFRLLVSEGPRARSKRKPTAEEINDFGDSAVGGGFNITTAAAAAKALWPAGLTALKRDDARDAIRTALNRAGKPAGPGRR